MKVLLNKYPKGTLKGQKTDGRYVDGFLYENLKLQAEAITKDMTFLWFISSSTLEVGTGKSVIASQIGEIWTELINDMYKDKFKEPITFSMDNCVFRPEELIKRSFEVPKYSMIWLDEWEDNHYWSALGMSLRQFFRKCRQLNLFMVCIIPNFFQLPSSYAISRSVAFIDVKFVGNFDRGVFDFYSFKRKRELYVKGKKTQNYEVTKPSFTGRFTEGYGVNEGEYRKLKYLDMLKYDKEEKNKAPTESQFRSKYFKIIHKNMPEVTIKRLAEGFCISERTAHNYLQSKNENNEIEGGEDATLNEHYTILTQSSNILPDPTVEAENQDDK